MIRSVLTIGPHRYEVTDSGLLFRMSTGRQIKGTPDKNGYLVTAINQKGIKLHRLVAQTFVENPKNLPEVNHLNGIKTDNRACNLKWVSHRENMKHSAETGLACRGSKRPMSKLTEENVLEIRRYFSLGASITDLTNRFGVSRGVIYTVTKNKSWKHVPAIAIKDAPRAKKTRKKT